MIRYYNRHQKKIEIEKVYGENLLSLLYDNRLGRGLTQAFFIRQKLSQIMGLYYNSSFSVSKIPEFIRNYEIDMSEFEEKDYTSFNDFFIRKFKVGKRTFDSNPSHLSAPCEARYLVYPEVNTHCKYPVKGQELTLEGLLGSKSLANDFSGGLLLVARLCPVDYHRFHYPCDAKIEDYFKIPGVFHSVNPKALKSYPGLFSINQREVTLLNSVNFGKLAYIEVGAMGVGKIVQKKIPQPGSHILKGEEKGWFEFGASTVLLLLQKRQIHINEDLKTHISQRIEVYFRLGEVIAESQ